jgi:hypothetical protein
MVGNNQPNLGKGGIKYKYRRKNDKKKDNDRVYQKTALHLSCICLQVAAQKASRLLARRKGKFIEEIYEHF